MFKMKLVVLDGYTLNPGDLTWDDLKTFGELVVYDRTPTDKIIERGRDAEIILTNKTRLNGETIHALPELKYIGVMATGFNIVDTEAASRKGIVVTNSPGYGTHSVAQITFALLLELCQHVQRHSDSVAKGNWSRSRDWSYWDFPLVELAGKTMGIIGFGTIGQMVASIATAFGMKILGTARTHTDQSHRKNFCWANIPEVLKNSDVVTMHCQLTPETKGLINRQTLGMMKNTAFLLNTSRGEIVVEEDLTDALNNGVIAGAGLDVLCIEPPHTDNALFKARNCIITPHIGWATKEARMRLVELVIKNLTAFLRGYPVNIVNDKNRPPI